MSNWFDNIARFNPEKSIDPQTTQTDSEILNTRINNAILHEDALKIPEYSVMFSNNTQSYCIGMVDMVDSTKISAKIGWAKASRYYEVFLNSMSEILKRFGGMVIKNIGDSLLYYFPGYCLPNRKFGFMSCLECSLTMMERRDTLCNKLSLEDLPAVNYRISADFGSVVIMKSNGSSLDMIGPPVNMCSKINHLANKNEIVIGSDLYEIVKNFDDYSYKEIKHFSIGLKYPYPVYTLQRNKTKV